MTMAVRGASALVVSLSFLLVSARLAAADCFSAECPKGAAVESVRELVAGSCDCAGASSHKKYVRCAKEVIRAAIAAGNLPKECKRTTRRCEARSTCGRDGAMVCCLRKAEGRFKPLVRGKNARCAGTACVGPLAAVDACNSDGTCAKPRRGVKSFRSVQHVFTTSCALPSCHSTFARQGGLVLDSEDVSYASLVNREAALPEAKAAGLLRVKAGDPDNSFLVRKLRALGPGESMPQGAGKLPDPVIDMVAEWIRRGAHTTEEECPSGSGATKPGVTRLCDPDDTTPGNFVWHPEPPLEVPAASDGIQLYTPPRDIAPGTEWETCYAFPLDSAALAAQFGLPAGQVPVIRQQTYRMHQGSHHLLLYMYFGAHPEGWAQGYFPCQAANCTESNPNDCPSDAGDALIPVGGTQVAGTRYEVNYPQGVGVPILGRTPVLIVNEHYTNPFQPPQPIYGEAWLNLHFYKTGEFKAILDGIFAINFRDLIVEPFQSRTISSIWQPRNILSHAPEDAALFQLFGHMHKRGSLFQIDYVKDGKCSVSQALCGRDGDCACKPWQDTCTPGQTCVRGVAAEDTTIYYTTAWDAAPIIDFPSPYFFVNRDQGLRWTCTHVNGVTGDPAHPPKICREGCEACGWDAATRTCVFTRGVQLGVDASPRVFAEGAPMPLVFGLLADDDMCNMFGYFINQADLSKIQ